MNARRILISIRIEGIAGRAVGGWAPTACLYWDEKDWPNSSHAAQTIGAARDTDFLTWRYKNHPDFDYKFLIVPEGKRTGLAVWRLETIRTETPHGRRGRRPHRTTG